VKFGKPPTPAAGPLRRRPPLDLDPMDQIQSNRSQQKPYWSNLRNFAKETFSFIRINLRSYLVQKYLQKYPFSSILAPEFF
jgi:hypothetical protein